MREFAYLMFSAVVVSVVACTPAEQQVVNTTPEKVRLIIDTDANNELDDQYALTYVLHNADVFDLDVLKVAGGVAGGDLCR